MDEHREALRRGLSVIELITRGREEFAALPAILDVANRLSDETITEAHAIEEIAGLIADGTIHPRILGRMGDHPPLIKAVADRLL